MSKAVKIIISVMAGLVVVVVAAMVLATLLIDPNDYKDDIAKAVREKTGRELVFKGDLQLSVFPWIGVSTGGISLSNAPGFAEEKMFSLNSADVGVKLMPLLSGKVELGNVGVDGLHLYLMRNKKGITNWDDLTSTENKDQHGKQEKSGKTGSSKSLNLSVAGVNINNARIVWDDQMEGVRQSIEDCDVTVNGFAPGSPFDFAVHVAASSSKPEVNADINISGVAKLSADLKKVDVTGLKTVVDAEGAAVPGGKGQVNLAADVALDMLKGTADITGLVLEAYGLKAEGNIKTVGLNGKAPSFSGDISVPAFNLKDSLTQMAMPLETRDGKALTSVGMNFNFAGTTSSAEINNLLLNLDETTIKGMFAFKNPERPDIMAQVDIDSLDADRYLPPEGDKKEPEKQEEGSATEKDAAEKQGLIPVELLRKLTLKADLTIKRLIAAKAKIDDVLVKARVKDGVLSIKPASLNVAEGAFTSTTVVDVRGKLPSISLAASLSGLNGNMLAKDMTGKDSFSGKASFNTSLKTVGNDIKTIYANLNGNLGFKVLDGYISGFDILYLAGDAFSVLTGGAFGKRDSKRTEFGEVSATADINKGVATNNDLLMQSPLLRAAGSGKLDLNTMLVDYALDAKIVGTLEGQGGKGMEDLVGLTVPVTIKGAVADPSIMVDLPKFAAILAKSGFKIAGSVIEGVGDILEGIGSTFSGKKGDTAKDSKSGETKKNPVQELGNTIKNLF